MTTPHRTGAIPVVIDTDTGTDIDDVLAILLALASPEVDLVGVTVVDGDVDLRARIVARLLGQLGRADIPVLRGLGSPLGPGRMPTMRGHEGQGILDVDWDGPEAVIGDEPAPDWLVRASHGRPLHVVAIGPYTNVARAIQLDPGFAARLTGLTVMGGMVDETRYTPAWQRYFADHHIPPAWLDHNTASDPTAALVCARSGAPMTWVTAELTFGTPLHHHAFDLLAAAPPSAATDSVTRMLRIWADDWFRYTGHGPLGPSPFPPDAIACLHDPLALAALFPGPWLDLDTVPLDYRIEDDLFRTVPDPAGTPATVSTRVDQPAFEAFVLDRIAGLLHTL